MATQYNRMRALRHHMIDYTFSQDTRRGAIMTKGENLSEFELYLQQVQRRSRRSLSEIEKLGTDAALDRCRDLARQVQSSLNKMPVPPIDIHSWADLQVSLERAASVLAQKSGPPPKKGIQDEP